MSVPSSFQNHVRPRESQVGLGLPLRCWALFLPCVGARNGKGKSTLLKFLASRRVGGLDPSLSVHYVNQASDVTAAPGRLLHPLQLLTELLLLPRM